MKTMKRSYCRMSRSRLILHLIGEELKSHKFFSGLQALGIDAGQYQPNLGVVILGVVGIADPSDELYHFFFELIRKHSPKITGDKDSVARQARRVYEELRGITDITVLA